MAQLKGFVTHIIYRNNGNGYTVFELNTGDEITCVGTFQSLEEGEILELEGDFTEHAVYGSQFKVSSFKFSSPEDAARGWRDISAPGRSKESALRGRRGL